MPISEDRLHEDTISVRNEELRTIWIANGFWILIHGYFISFVIEKVNNPGLAAVTCLVGMTLGVFWLQSIDKMWGWLGLWNGGLVIQQNDVPEDKRIFGGRRYEEESQRGVSINTIIESLVWVFIVSWYFVAIFKAVGFTI